VLLRGGGKAPRLIIIIVEGGDINDKVLRWAIPQGIFR
jgi:hypothetical protein